MMNTIRIIHNYSCKSSSNILLDEKSNVDVTKFFKLLQDFDELLWDKCTTYNLVCDLDFIFFALLWFCL